MLDAVKDLLNDKPILEMTASLIAVLLTSYGVYWAETKRRNVMRGETLSNSEVLDVRAGLRDSISLQNIERQLGEIANELRLIRANEEATSAVISDRWRDQFVILRGLTEQFDKLKDRIDEVYFNTLRRGGR